MSKLNRKFELAARLVGVPKRTDWAYKEEPVRETGEGELLIKILHISRQRASFGRSHKTIRIDFFRPVPTGL